MAFTDKPESANEAQDHSQPVDDGGFFSLNDVIVAGRHQLTRSEHLLAVDTRRNVRNLFASAKLLILVVIVSLAMGVAAWAFLASLNIATDYREHHAWIYALLPVVGVATAWVYKNHGLAAKRGNNLVIDSALGTRLIHMRMAVLTFVCSTLTHLTGGSAGREGAAVQIGGTIASVPNMTPKTVVIVVISAIIFGLTARLFAWSVRTVKSLYGRFITNYLVRALIGALVVLAAYALLDAWNYAGLSTWLSGAGFAGNTTLADAAIKLVVTALTLGAGFQGGEVTPLFGIGAALGGWIGCLTGLDPSFLAALGMLGVFCAGLNVPITTCMMAIDLFHGTAAGFFVIVAFISYLTAGHRGVYPAQRIISPKRRSLIVDEGGTVADAIERHNDLIE